MSTIEEQLKNAFKHVRAPENAKAQTLQAIEERRVAEATYATKRKSIRARRIITATVSLAACFALAFVGFSALKTTNVANVTNTINTAELTTATQQSTSAQSATQATPAAYVSIDINPSLEFEINAEGTVIRAEALNSDAQAILTSLSVDGLPYKTALNTLLNSKQIAPYLTNQALLEVNVASDNATLSDELTSITNAELATHHAQSSCNQTTMQHHQEAASHGMGMARYQAATELMALDPSLTIEECASMSMRELRSQIVTHHAEATPEQHNPHHS